MWPALDFGGIKTLDHTPSRASSLVWLARSCEDLCGGDLRETVTKVDHLREWCAPWNWRVDCNRLAPHVFVDVLDPLPFDCSPFPWSTSKWLTTRPPRLSSASSGPHLP